LTDHSKILKNKAKELIDIMPIMWTTKDWDDFPKEQWIETNVMT